MEKYIQAVYLSRILILISFSILFYNIYVTKDVSDFSYLWITLVLLAQFLLLFFGFVNHQWGIIVPSILISFVIFYILMLKMNENKNEVIKKQLVKKDIL